MKITSTTFTWKLLSTLIIVGVVIAATIVFVAIKLQSNHHRSNNTARVPLIPRDDGGFQARMQRDKDRVAGLAKLLNFSIYDPQFSYGGSVIPGEIFATGEYLVQVEIGNPPVMQHLIIDTGSDLMWVQCQPCELCYTQWDPMYNRLTSATYTPMNCSSKECSLLDKFVFGCDDRVSNDQQCGYKYPYLDGSFTNGMLMGEKITVGGVCYDIAVGCGTRNNGSFDMIPGVMGLGDSPLSYVNQLGDMHRGGFSYCLSSNYLSATSWLEFGLGSISLDSGWVPFQKNVIPGLPLYYISLTGVGVDYEKLPIPEHVFQLTEKNVGGVILDTGTVITRFPRSVYEVLRNAYVTKASNITRAPAWNMFDTCFNLSDIGEHFMMPTVSFFFSTEGLHLGGPNTLIKVDGWDTYCLAFMPHDNKISIIGNLQQAGIQVSYDLLNRRVAFGSRIC